VLDSLFSCQHFDGIGVLMANRKTPGLMAERPDSNEVT
jgi:hypothetical protein